MSMRHLATGALLIAVLGLCGCKRAVAPSVVVEDPNTHLQKQSEVAIAEWLDQTRPELDKRYEDWKSKASTLIDLARGDRQTHALLPKLRPVLTLPVFQEARFSARAGLSLPPYAEEGRKDAVLALHLARFGDADGALLLVDPANDAARREIESLRPGKNYP